MNFCRLEIRMIVSTLERLAWLTGSQSRLTVISFNSVNGTFIVRGTRELKLGLPQQFFTTVARTDLFNQRGHIVLQVAEKLVALPIHLESLALERVSPR
jgi:hypothetical protein